jgi:hypothetical protein
MVLSVKDHLKLLKGFKEAGFVCVRAPTSPNNPIQIEWHSDGQVRRFRLWAFDVTHGGGGAEVRAADEFRIQITNGPDAPSDFDKDAATDLLIGYSRDRDAIVAYDRRWLEKWSEKKSTTGSGGSPSVQVKEADIQAGHSKGLHHLTKTANFGEADIVTMSPASLPGYLLNHAEVLGGEMTADDVQAVTPLSGALNVVEYCRSQGFPFETDLIARYLAALLTKPFVILAGVSGTGKSKLAELVAEFYSASAGPGGGATPAPGNSFLFVPAKGKPDATRFALVAVRPDWIDNQSILGFVNPITERYESTQALDLILRAQAAHESTGDKAKADRYFMLLDEMNLARVEHYFSDWLACTESRRYRPDNSINQQPVPLHRAEKPMKTTLRRPDGSSEVVEVPPSLALPTNLVVTGTVNVDETTYGFSPKVLDRAMVIEFDEVDLERLRSGGGSITADGYQLPADLPGFRLATGADYTKLPLATHGHLVKINKILEGARLHFGYRAANEIGLFMAIYNGMLPLDPADGEWLRALDAAILQKALPRLQGNRAKLEEPLARLCGYLQTLSEQSGDLTLAEYDASAAAKLPKAFRRAVEMLEALRDFGFVTFFK